MTSFEKAKQAIEDLIADRSVKSKQLKEQLEELSCLCDGQVEAMKEEESDGR